MQAQVLIRELQRYTGVLVAGRITSVFGNKFILDDGTGQLLVDAGPSWYRQIQLVPGERVTVLGKYDDEDFDAYRITRENGEVIEIRPASGPPPWAGGSRDPR
ncbi:DNA-binding protein [Synechococcus sp. H55.7]|uniref:OB-fold nucleic acid binding domain-containing protein n=1 Tax=unclassified Synechococcus TaxID=2626047 RepID=UPI0039C031DD